MLLLSAGAARAISCGDEGPEHVAVTCPHPDKPNTMLAEIGEATLGALDFWLSAEDEFVSNLEVLNAGVIEVEGGAALTLTANNLTYHGVSSARLVSYEGAAIEAITKGYTALSIGHSMEAKTGISLAANSTAFQKLAINLDGAIIDASEVGIKLVRSGDGGEVDISIGTGSEIRMSETDVPALQAAINVSGTARAKVVLAGKILGTFQNSTLSDADDIVELHPGYELEGTIDAGLNAENGGDRLSIFGSHTLLASNLTNQFLGFEALQIGDGATLRAANELITFESVNVSGTLALGVGSLVAEDVVFQHSSILEIEIGADSFGQLDAGRLTIINGSKVRIVNTTKRTGTFGIVLFDDGIFGAEPAKFVLDYEDDLLMASLDYRSNGIFLDIFRREEEDPETETDPGTEPQTQPDPQPQPHSMSPTGCIQASGAG